MNNVFAKNPQVSILVPLYNSESYLPSTLESVVNQTFPFWEAIVVDDCSTDDGLKIASSFASRDSRFRVFSQSANRGGSSGSQSCA